MMANELNFLTEEQIEKNWKQHLHLARWIDGMDSTDGSSNNSTQDILLKYSDKIVLAPASTRPFYHNAFFGGYVEHVNRVMEFAANEYKRWKEDGFKLNFTTKDLMVAALFHDFGKIFDVDVDFYQQADDWWIRNKNVYFEVDQEIQFWKVPHRSLYLLQREGYTLSENSYLGILLHDGMYNEGSKPYLTQFSEGKQMKVLLPHILHVADHRAMLYEKHRYFNSKK